MLSKKPPVLPDYAIGKLQVGDIVAVIDGATHELCRRGWMADYITEEIDGKKGTVVADHMDETGCPHLAVELGFSHPVGIPLEFLAAISL